MNKHISIMSTFGALLQQHITKRWGEKVMYYYTICLFKQWGKQSHSLNAVESEAGDQTCQPLNAWGIWCSDLFLGLWSTICSVTVFYPHSGKPTTNDTHEHQQSRTSKSSVCNLACMLFSHLRKWINKSEYISHMQKPNYQIIYSIHQSSLPAKKLCSLPGTTSHGI